MNLNKHLLVLRKSSRHLQDMSWRRLQHAFSVTIWHLPKHLEDILQDVLKMSWKTTNCYAGDVLKTCWRYALKTCWRHVLKTSWRYVLKMSWRHVLKTSWRHYGDKQNTYWGYLYLTNLNVYLTNLFHKSTSDSSKANQKCIN